MSRCLDVSMSRCLDVSKVEFGFSSCAFKISACVYCSMFEDSTLYFSSSTMYALLSPVRICIHDAFYVFRWQSSDCST